jgi:diacylglycerol kinase
VPCAGKALLVASVLLVISIEWLKSVVEVTTARSSLENGLLAQRATDVASAPVLVAVINALMVWSLVRAG